MAEYTSDLRTTALHHRCIVCRRMAVPQLMRAIFRRDKKGSPEQLVAWAHPGCGNDTLPPFWPTWQTMEVDTSGVLD